MLFWAIERPALLGRAVVWSGGPFFVGSVPFWYGTFQSNFETFFVTAPHPPRFSERLSRLLDYRLPIVLGIRFDGGTVPTLPVLSWLLLPIQLGAFGVTVSIARGSSAPRVRRAARLLVLVTVMLFAVYLPSPFSGADTQRYLVPLYTLLVIAPALLVVRLGRAGSALGLLLLALQTVPAVREADILDPEALRRYEEDRARESRIFQTLDDLGLHAVYSDDYWDGARFTFDARERIVFANPFEDRSTVFLDRADGAEHPAFLFRHPLGAAAFEGTLRLASARYRKEPIEGFELFYAIEPEIEGAAEVPIVGAAAGDNAIDTRLAFDRDGTTRWTTLAPQRPGMWFTSDLGAGHEIAEVALLPRFASDAPRGLRVEVSLDGQTWTRAAEARTY